MIKTKLTKMQIILIVVILGIFISMQNTIPKEAVADIEGKACIEDSDCPCWGKIGEDTSAYGIGVGSCSTENKCDMTYCVDVQPIAEWAKDNPFNWIKSNIEMTFLLIGLAIVIIYWPKV